MYSKFCQFPLYFPDKKPKIPPKKYFNSIRYSILNRSKFNPFLGNIIEVSMLVPLGYIVHYLSEENVAKRRTSIKKCQKVDAFSRAESEWAESSSNKLSEAPLWKLRATRATFIATFSWTWRDFPNTCELHNSYTIMQCHSRASYLQCDN